MLNWLLKKKKLRKFKLNLYLTSNSYLWKCSPLNSSHFLWQHIRNEISVTEHIDLYVFGVHGVSVFIFGESSVSFGNNILNGKNVNLKWIRMLLKNTPSNRRFQRLGKISGRHPPIPFNILRLRQNRPPPPPSVSLCVCALPLLILPVKEYCQCNSQVHFSDDYFMLVSHGASESAFR